MKIAICDDEKIYLDKLFSDLKTLEEYKDEFNITAFTAGEELLLNYTAGTYDIIVLDIEMKTINGMEVAEHIRKLDSDVTIIFLTNYESFATKGYVIGAFRYILKDQPRELYIQQLKETIQSVYNKRKPMPVTINKEVRKVFIDDIIYIEVYVVFGYNIVQVLREYKKNVKREIEKLTTMNVQEVSVMAKGIYVPENQEGK